MRLCDGSPANRGCWDGEGLAIKEGGYSWEKRRYPIRICGGGSQDMFSNLISR